MIALAKSQTPNLKLHTIKNTKSIKCQNTAIQNYRIITLTHYFILKFPHSKIVNRKSQIVNRKSTIPHVLPFHPKRHP